MAQTPLVITPAEFRAIIKRLGLRRIDVAWMMDVSRRQCQRWLAGEAPIPQPAMLLLKALEEGKISPTWLRNRIKAEIPYYHSDWN